MLGKRKELGPWSGETGRYRGEEVERRLWNKKKKRGCLPYGKSLKSRLADARTSIHISGVKARDSVTSSPEESDERRREEPEILPAGPGKRLAAERRGSADRSHRLWRAWSWVCALNMMMKKRTAARSSL